MSTNSTTDALRDRQLGELLSAMALGDRLAFETLYRKTSSYVYGIVLRIVVDQGQAEDVLQECYVKVWRSAASFNPALSQPMTWLINIARNAAIDSLRRLRNEPLAHAARADADDEVADQMSNIADEQPGPLELLTQASDRARLSCCLEGLSQDQQSSLALAYFQGLSHQEVAASLGQPLGTIKSWIRRGLMSMKDCLDQRAGRAV